ncbi:MAG TPA: T9SS type A sorting domain-containing protein [Bacteroidia bacterium]|nr:T9SS type A sorting domain-containing protein [Bacteroidia bacterium]
MKKLVFTLLTAFSLVDASAQTAFFDKTCYRGAFAPAPNPMWTDTWTEWDPQNKVYPAPTMTVSGNITTNTTWSTGQVILLSTQCFVKNNSVLTIQPGVIVLGDKAVTGAGLFITKGSQLIADGTKSNPIVFSSNQAPGQRGLGDWGGVILLGKGYTNNSGGINNIEGLPISSDTEYGGGASPDPNDNSGILRYVRIEFGGYVYQPNQEINGLTFGAVGKGTTIDYVQVSFANDDAFEWFGGSVDCKHLVSYRNLDDDFDTDNGFSGRVQYGLAVRDPQIADNPSVSTSENFESDNDPNGTSANPVTSGIFCNMTCIGPRRPGVSSIASGFRRGARIRRNSQLKIFNSILMDMNTRGLFIDGSACENNAAAGTLKFKNNILANYGQRATESGTFGIINTNTFVAANANDTLLSSSNILASPYNFTAPDYRPASGSIALSNVSFTDAALSGISANNGIVMATIPSSMCIGNNTVITPGVFVASTTVTPAYCSLTWSVSSGLAVSNATLESPTFTANLVGSLSATLSVMIGDALQSQVVSIVTSTCDNVGIQESENVFNQVKLVPNPAQDKCSAVFELSQQSHLSYLVSDVSGKVVLQGNPEVYGPGRHEIDLNTSNLNNGIYFMNMRSDSGSKTMKLIVQR